MNGKSYSWGSSSIENPSSGQVIGKISAGSEKDVDIAVAAAQKAFKTTWGLHTPGAERGRLLNKLADLIEENAEELAALETLDTGTFLLLAARLLLKLIYRGTSAGLTIIFTVGLGLIITAIGAKDFDKALVDLRQHKVCR